MWVCDWSLRSFFPICVFIEMFIAGKIFLCSSRFCTKACTVPLNPVLPMLPGYFNIGNVSVLCYTRYFNKVSCKFRVHPVAIVRPCHINAISFCHLYSLFFSFLVFYGLKRQKMQTLSQEPSIRCSVPASDLCQNLTPTSGLLAFPLCMLLAFEKIYFVPVVHSHV